MASKTKPSLRLKWSVRVHACVPWKVCVWGGGELGDARGNEQKREWSPARAV